METVNNLPYTLSEVESLNAFKARLQEWQTTVKNLFAKTQVKSVEGSRANIPTVKQLEELVTFGRSVAVELDELESLRLVS